MNEKEIAEIRRRYRFEKNSITHVRGCYVNEKGEIVSEFNQSLGLMSQDECERFLAMLRRTLTGSQGKNLMDISFETQQVVSGEEHKLLMELRASGLSNDQAVQAFFQRTIASVTIEGNYLILLSCDKYDVPYRSADGEKQHDASSEVFSYVLCSICPVKLTKPALGYHAHENRFCSLPPDWVVSPPELGFLFPAFDDRSTNLYGALYYSRDLTDNHNEFVDAVFRSPAPMPAAAQKETFHTLLEDALSDDCCYEVVQTVHDQLTGMIALHKESKVPEALTLSKGAVKTMLKSCGVSDSVVTSFDASYDREFGEEADLSPRNLVESKMEICTPDVTIHVNPQRSDLVETRVINGAKYILIRADEGVAVNGVNIFIS